MKKNYWLFLFIFLLAVHLSGIFFDINILQWISKPLLIITLACYFFAGVKAGGDSLAKWVFAALFFSWTGDILLMFQLLNENFFLAGLLAFLIAHIFYIVFFQMIRVRENIKRNWWLLLPVILYYSTLISVLSPHLGKFNLPVRIYGAVISFMFMMALQMLFIKNQPAGRQMASGALLFLLSDSVLAFNKFYRAWEWAAIIVMLTYGLAQLFIIMGTVKFIGKE